MREFFRGWKRKVGVVTLVIACQFMVGWLRSIYYEDSVLIRTGSRTMVAFETESGSIRWAIITFPDRIRFLKFIVWECVPSPHSGLSVIEMAGATRHDVQYRFVVIPATCLAVYLLLCKSRFSASQTTGYAKNDGNENA